MRKKTPKKEMDHFYDVTGIKTGTDWASSIADSVFACCRRGVGFESDPHRVILEILKIVPTAAMPGTLVIVVVGMPWLINNSLPCTVRTSWQMLFNQWVGCLLDVT